MSQADKLLRQIVPWMLVNRTFKDYSESTRARNGRKLEDVLLDKLAFQGEAIFYDLGCGYGYASLDFIEVVEKRARKRRLPLRLLEGLRYVGIDNFITDQVPIRDERIQFYSPLDLRNLRGKGLPPMDLGVSFFVFPYLDKKLEVVSNVYNLLRIPDKINDAGQAIFTNYNYDQLKWGSKSTKKDTVIRLQHIDPHMLVKGEPDILLTDDDTLYLQGGRGYINTNTSTRFLTSVPEETSWSRYGPKGKRAGQVVSIYGQRRVA